jgi:hypothetical protein
MGEVALLNSSHPNSRERKMDSPDHVKIKQLAEVAKVGKWNSWARTKLIYFLLYHKVFDEETVSLSGLLRLLDLMRMPDSKHPELDSFIERVKDPAILPTGPQPYEGEHPHEFYRLPDEKKEEWDVLFRWTRVVVPCPGKTSRSRTILFPLSEQLDWPWQKSPWAVSSLYSLLK